MLTLYQNKTEPTLLPLRLFIRTAKVLTGKHGLAGGEKQQQVYRLRFSSGSKEEENIMKRTKLISLVLTFSLAVTTIMTGCSSSESYKESKSTATTYEYPAEIYRSNDATYTESYMTEAGAYTEAYEEEAGAVYDGFYYDTASNGMNVQGGQVGTTPAQPGYNTEEYLDVKESGFKKTTVSPLSTFAADVDTGSLSNIRRLLNESNSFSSIPSGAVRTEEMINYFDYTAGAREDGKRFSLNKELHACPWNEDNDLLMLTVTANEVQDGYVGSNFVFLVDTSGSMYGSDRLDLAVKGFKMLTDSLTENDRVSLVTYSGSFETILDGVSGDQHSRIRRALDSLEASGCTNGSAGINEAYRCAEDNFIKGGNNRVIVASDGDMNMGITSTSGLTDLIREKKESGVFLTVLGFGAGNYSDANMESIADAGNGNYYYIDCEQEAKRVLVDKLKSTTVTVAKDVKFQIEFNPAVVAEYRQIGYENRTMAAEDFNDDKKDGGEVGAGSQVTVCYEISYNKEAGNNGIELKYQENKLKESTKRSEMLTLAIRYKEPDADTSVREEHMVLSGTDDRVSPDYAWAAGIIELSMNIRGSEYIGTSTYETALMLMSAGAESRDEARSDFRDLIKKTARI